MSLYIPSQEVKTRVMRSVVDEPATAGNTLIAQSLNLSVPTVVGKVNELLEVGFVEENGLLPPRLRSQVGRRAIRYQPTDTYWEYALERESATRARLDHISELVYDSAIAARRLLDVPTFVIKDGTRDQYSEDTLNGNKIETKSERILKHADYLGRITALAMLGDVYGDEVGVFRGQEGWNLLITSRVIDESKI